MLVTLDEALEAFVRVLAYVYASINWRRIKVKSPHDVWNHRVRAAVTRATVDEAIARLCNYFSIQSLPPAAVLMLKNVRELSDEVLDIVSRQHITYAMEAVILAQTLRRRSTAQLTLEHAEEETHDGSDSEDSRAD